MLDDWLAGHVPQAVMADWCEERGTVFPRHELAVVRRTRARGGSWALRRRVCRSSSRLRVTERSLSHVFRQRNRTFSASQSRSGTSIGSKSSNKTRSLSRSRTRHVD